MVRLFAHILVVPLLVLCVACADEPDTPEARVREMIAAMEAAAEAGDVSAFQDGVSEKYGDARGHDKAGLRSYVTFHVLHNRNRQVAVRVRDVLIVSPGHADVVLVAGIAGATPTGPSAALRGNVYQVDANFEEEEPGVWRLTWAQWKPTAATDLL